ncbi:MAG TPA: GFA family protein [Gammaproteobacteria bacterium]|nr:GFA family protein [Gammaproteobacteria bacterium]
MTRGVCLCGTVRYEFAAPFEMMMHCHCSMCRKHHGAPFATFVSAPFTAFKWLSGEDSVATYQSSRQGMRAYCRHCGSVAPLLMAEAGFAIAPAGNLEGDLGIRPQGHMFAGSKAAWYTIADSLPQHEGYPPEFGGGLGLARPQVKPRSGVAEGSCLCGAVAYEVREPLRMYHCHCWRCRRARSAAHTTNLFAKLDDFAFTRGEELVTDYKVPEAQRFAVAFCTRCGGKAPRIARERNAVVVPAGTLDTNPGVQPQAHIYVDSKAPWFDIMDGLPQYSEMAPLA